MSRSRSSLRPGWSRRGATCALLLGLLLCSVVRAAPTPVPGTVLFTDPSGRYSFQVPPEWQPRQLASSPTSRAWQSSSPAGNFQIDTAAVTVGTTLDDFVRQTVATIKGGIPDTDADASKAQSMTLGGLPARRLDYTGTVSGNRAQMTNIVALQNNIAYVLSAVALPANAGPFMDRVRIVLDSFTFLMPTTGTGHTGIPGGVIAALIAVIVLLALLALLYWNRTRGPGRAHRQRTRTQPIVGLDETAAGPPGVPIDDAPLAEYPDSATTPLALHGTTAMPVATEAEQRRPPA